MYNRGINFKQYYILFKNLDEGKTEEMTRAEYREKLIELLAKDLEKNFLNGHIYKENIKQIQRRDYFAKLKIEYYPTCGDKLEIMYITFLHDSVCINGLYIKY